MELEKLQEKKALLEEGYKKAELEKQDHLNKAKAIQDEQLRADGEYRLILDMIKEQVPTDPPTEAVTLDSTVEGTAEEAKPAA